MQKQIIFSCLMLIATAVSAQWIDFKPGKIVSIKTDSLCEVTVITTPPTPEYLKECNFEISYKDAQGLHNILLYPYSCKDTFTFTLPFADTFTLIRRVFWRPVYGTQWRTTNARWVYPCIPVDEQPAIPSPPTVPSTVQPVQPVSTSFDCATVQGETLYIGCEYPGHLVITNAWGHVMLYQQFIAPATFTNLNLTPGLWFAHLVYITPDGYRDEVETIFQN